MRPIKTLLALLALSALAPVHAQPTGDEADEARTSSDPVLQQVVAHLEAGEDAEALQLLETLRESEEPPVEGLALLGAVYVQTGRPAEALEVLVPLTQLDPPDPAVLYNAGRAALAMGRLQPAAELLRRSVQVKPDSPAARELGLLLGSQGAYTESLALLKPWAERYPEDAEARLAAAFAAVQLERIPDAEALLSDLPQDRPQVKLLWGRLLLAKGDPWGALNTLQPAVESAPPEMELDIRRATAEAYAAVGQAAEAVEVLADFAQNNPSVALQLSQAQYQAGDLEGALGTLRPFAGALVAGDARIPDEMAGRIVLHYGRFLTMSGQHEEALPYLELATEWRPDDKQAWQMLGQTLAGLDRREDARVALERFQEISKAEISASRRDTQERAELDDPTLKAIRETWELLGEERFDEALERIRQERAIARNDIRPVLLEGRVLTLMGRYDEALATAEEAVRAAPDNADAVYLRGTVRMARQELREAEADFRQALVLQPEHLATMNDLAVLLIERGETTEARQLLEQVLELNPADAVAAGNLERLQDGA